MHSIKGVLFDKDGTLLDFNRTWLVPYRRAAAYLHACFGERAQPQELLARGGFIAETETWQPNSPLACGRNQEIIELWSSIIGQPIEAATRHQLKSIFARAAEEYVAAYASEVDAWAPLFAELHQFKVKLGLATMDNEASAHHMLRAVGIATWFDFVCGADSGYGIKPDAGMVQAFCQACDLQCQQVIMVGDSPRDMHMGKNAGVALTVGVLSGVHDATALAPSADIVLNSIAELPAVLQQITPAYADRNNDQPGGEF